MGMPPVRRATPSPILDTMSMMVEMRRMHANFMRGMQEISRSMRAFETVKKGRPGLPGIGLKGKDGRNVTQAEVEAAVTKLYRQPKDGEAPTVEAITDALLKHGKFLKIVKRRVKDEPAAQPDVPAEAQDMQALIGETLLGMRQEFESRIAEVRNHVATSLAGKQYGKDTTVRGGGDVVEAGTNVTITSTVNGRKRISAVAASLTVKTVTGTIDDSNVTFTSASEPTLLNINGSFYQKTGGSFTWSYAAGTITISSPVGTGGSIFGV